MKEATGDMTMTVIVVIGAIAILALARPIWNLIKEKIVGEVNNVHAYVEVVDDYRL